MEKSFNWIAISSLIAIDKLFFERDYWVYFVLLPHNYVVMTKGLPFVKRQLSFSTNDEFLENIQDWMKSTRKLTRRSGLKFPIALDKLVEHLIKNPNDKTWHGSVIEIWQNRSNWECLYVAPEED